MQSGVYSMNIYDVSKKAGVSIATVSRVINNNTNVSPTTREKVLKVIEESEYIPNTFARGLGLNTMNTIGIMCADSSDPYMAKAIYYLEQGLRMNNYDVLLCCTGYGLSDKKKYLELLLSKRTDAIILVGSNFVEDEPSDNEYIKAAANKIPIMLLNGSLNGPNIYASRCDDYNAVYSATLALLQSGKKDIHYLYNAKSFSGNNKITGFVDALMTRFPNKKAASESIHFVSDSIQGTIDYLNLLTSKQIPFDAILTSDDSLAIGALRFAKKAGLNVPSQLSIIGYNNSFLVSCSDPELTSVDNKLDALCSSCINTLMGIFNNQVVPIETVFPGELIHRGTTQLEPIR